MKSNGFVSLVALCLLLCSGMEEAESRCCAFSLSLSLLRVSALSSLFPFPPRRRSLTPPHHFPPFLLCLLVKPFLLLWPVLSDPQEAPDPSFFRHGGRGGSRTQPASPDGPALHSTQQRVRDLQKRHAPPRRSGKKREELVGQIQPSLPPRLSKVYARTRFWRRDVQQNKTACFHAHRLRAERRSDFCLHEVSISEGRSADDI